MTHVIVQHCCADGGCVDVCPVNCIHPRPDDAGFRQAEMLYVDPAVCIDCGACADICPVDAILPDYDLEPHDRAYVAINADHFTEPGTRDYVPRRQPRAPEASGADFPLVVAIVGTGPAACYAAEHLLRHGGASIDMFERLLTPGGLARFGVAPDHLATKAITRRFDKIFADPRVTLHLGVRIGRDLDPADLAAGYDAVIYAIGTPSDRSLGIEGEGLAGNWSAAAFASWYNGHPDHADLDPDLGVERAVVIGNGNVALDIARILTLPRQALHRSDIAAHALEALGGSRVREVVVAGRRGPLDAAFTLPELLALRDNADVTLWTDLSAEAGSTLGQAECASPTARSKLDVILGLPRAGPRSGRSIRLSFFHSPLAVLGHDRVEGVRFGVNELFDGTAGANTTAPTSRTVTENTGLVVRATGFRGEALLGLPFDHVRGVIPHRGGRVYDPDGDAIVPRAYVAGWIKRGPSGVMGTNKGCALETVAALLEDARASRLGLGARTRPAVPQHARYAGWQAIDAQERASGAAIGRPRVKLVSEADLWRVAGAPRWSR